MSKIYIFAESQKLGAQLINLGEILGGQLYVVCSNQETVSKMTGYPVETVHILAGDSSRPEDYAQALSALLQDAKADLLLVADTIQGRELAAKTAAYLDVGLVSGASEVECVSGQFETTRIQYGGAVIKKERLAELAVVTVSEGKYPAIEAVGQDAPVVTHDVQPDQRVNRMEVAPIERQGVDLNTANVVVGVGLGFDKKEDLSLADDLAAVMDGAVGCTRPVADDKEWLPAEQYIGISGVYIHPDIYFAVGISGQIQHVVGVRDSKVVVAINKSDSAPIMKAADYGIVGDLYDILPVLTDKVRDR